MRSVRVLITGRVQGVGYRAFVRHRAVELGLRGWVKNRADGSVEALAEGAEEPLARFVDALRQGSWRAEVEDVTAEWGEPAGSPEGFRVTG